MYRSKVLMIDAIFAVHLINLTNGIGKECSRFPTDTEISYTKEGKKFKTISSFFLGKFNKTQNALLCINRNIIT